MGDKPGQTQDEAPPCMRWRGLARSRGTFPPISQRPLRRSTTYQGQEHSRFSGRDQFTGWLGASPRRGSGFPLCQRAGVSPKPGGADYFLSRWLRAFFSPIDRGFPQAKRLKSSLRRVAQSFLLIAQLGVSPPPHNLKFSLRRRPRVFLLRTRLGVSPPPHTLKYSLRRWLKVSPCGFPSCRVAPDFPPRPEAPKSAQYRVARGFPRTGGSEFPPCRWRRTSPCPKARSCPLPGGSGFPLRRLPSLVVRKFLRLSPRLHKRFRPAISRFFRRPQAIHS
jgi:hypothetical protein